MAIPSNYIDKITKEGDSRMICPAADKVRVDNENFEADNLEDVLDEVAEAIEDGGYNPPIPKTDLASDVQTSLGKADTAVQDNDYTHTDNNYTNADKAAVATIADKADADDVYDKSTVDDMVAEAGKVKTVSVNGGTPAQPDTNGNVNLVVQAGAQGPKGDKGDTVVLDPQGLPQFEIINDLTTGGEADALSAEMGRRLAMLSGTFAEAWAHAQAIPYVFPWLWVETVNGDAICKPIWHHGSNNFVDAAGASISIEVTGYAGVPTISGTEDSTVPKDTVITITPASGCALHYSVDGGSTYKVADRAVNITLSTAGAKTIMAYCSNPNGNSSTVTRHITVAGTAVPTLPTSGEIARGGSVTISVPTGGELHYRINGGSWVTSANLSESITIANHLNQQEQMVIEAYNIVGGDQSDTVTGTYTMATLQAPTLTPAGSEVTSGSTVAITAPDGNIYYTTDGSDPTDQSTAYSSAIAITAQTTIKAVAKDNYGYSAVTSETYTIAVPKFMVETNAAGSTVTFKKTGNSDIVLNLNNGVNEFPIDTALGNVTNFDSCVFSDKSKIVTVDFAGITLNGAVELFKNASNLESVVGLTVNGSIQQIFNTCGKLRNIQLSGTVTNASGFLAYINNTGASATPMSIDFSGLHFASGTNAFQFAAIVKITSPFDISTLNISNTTDLRYAFYQCFVDTLIVGDTFAIVSSISNPIFSGCEINTVRITSTTPPPLSGNYIDWVAALKTVRPNIVIEVPSGCKTTYTSDSAWTQYEPIITEYND